MAKGKASRRWAVDTASRIAAGRAVTSRPQAGKSRPAAAATSCLLQKEEQSERLTYRLQGGIAVRTARSSRCVQNSGKESVA